MSREELLRAGRRPGRGGRGGRRCGRAGSTSSSASPGSRSTSRSCSRAARGRGQAVDHLLFAGPPGLGKTTLSGIVAAEMDVSLRITSGPALERAGDLAAILTNLDDGDVLFIDEIHRLPAAGRGGALPGDGGLPARHRDRQGPVGALDPPRPAALHARRRHHPHRPHHRPAARPLRLRRPPRLLRPRRPRRDHRARRAHPRRAARADGRARDRPPGPRHAAHRQPPAEAGPRLRRGAGRRHGHRRRSPATRSRCSRSTSSASTRSTAPSSPRCARRSPASRSGCTRWRWRWPRSPTPSRRSTSRSCSSRACSSARPGAGSPRPAAYRAPRSLPPPAASAGPNLFDGDAPTATADVAVTAALPSSSVPLRLDRRASVAGLHGRSSLVYFAVLALAFFLLIVLPAAAPSASPPGAASPTLAGR